MARDETKVRWQNGRYDLLLIDPTIETLLHHIEQSIMMTVLLDGEMWTGVSPALELVRGTRSPDGIRNWLPTLLLAPTSGRALDTVGGMAWFTDWREKVWMRLFAQRGKNLFGSPNSCEEKTWFGAPSMVLPLPCECVFPILYNRWHLGSPVLAWEDNMREIIIANPLCWEERNAYADWLEDQDRPAEASVQREAIGLILARDLWPVQARS